MQTITPGVLYLERTDWRADAALPRLGGPEDPRRAGGWPLVPPSNRLYYIWHHTVGVDNDLTVNVWETMDEVRTQMRQLQRIRPDLGLDVPYNFVLFFMADETIVVGEGRGYYRAGAHTAGVDSATPPRYFNVAGIACAVHANMEDFALDIGPWLPKLNLWGAHLKRLLPHLGTATVCGQFACGHRDYSRFSGLNATACPGQHLYRRLPELTLTPPAPAPPPPPPAEEDIMVVGHFAKSIPWDRSYVVTVGKEGARKTLVASAAEYESLLAAGRPVKVMAVAQLRKIISSPGTPEA